MSRSNEKGFTLLEILIAIVLFAIVLGAVYTLYSASQTTFTRGQSKVDVQQSGRVAIGTVARELRVAGYDPSDARTALCACGGNQIPAIEAAAANTITFVADVNGDGDTNRVTYRLQGTQIMRDIATWNPGPPPGAFPAPTSAVLADGVSTFAFTYYDGNDAVTAVLADIRRVAIGVTTQQTAGGEQVSFPLTMDVRLRNP